MLHARCNSSQWQMPLQEVHHAYFEGVVLVTSDHVAGTGYVPDIQAGNVTAELLDSSVRHDVTG